MKKTEFKSDFGIIKKCKILRLKMKKRAGAYYTVEATFVVSICIWVLVAILYGGFYVHDRAVLESVVNSRTASWLQPCGSDKKSEEEWKEGLKEKLNKSLFLLSVSDISHDNAITFDNVAVNCSLPVSFSLLKQIWTGGDGSITEECSRENICPAKFRWDVDMVK